MTPPAATTARTGAGEPTPRCHRPRRLLRLWRAAQGAEGRQSAPRAVSWQDTAVTCALLCQGKRRVVPASRWRRADFWRRSGTRSALAPSRWKGSLLSSETPYAGWALWRPVMQDWKGASCWPTRWEAIVRFSAVKQRSRGEAVASRIPGHSAPAPSSGLLGLSTFCVPHSTGFGLVRQWGGTIR